MRLHVLSLAMLLTANMAVAQTDTVVMKVNGKPVSLSEFKFFYDRDNSSDEGFGNISVKDYLSYFINFKLEEAEAYALRLDTVSSLEADYDDVRQKTVALALVTDEDIEAEARQIYSETKENVGQRGLVRPAHILLYVRQDATNAEFEGVRRRADSLYTAVKNGADFAQLAKKHSQDEASALNGGALPWIQPNQTLKEFEDAAYSLNVGDVSRPVQSPLGFHVIKMLERKQLEPYDSLRGTIIKMLSGSGIRKQIVSRKVNDVVKASNGTLKPAEALKKIKADKERNDPEVRTRLNAYRSELLCYAAYNKFLDGRKPFAEPVLKAWFNKNKKRYYWDEPRFKGIVIHAKTRQDLQEAAACIKDVPYNLWSDVIEKRLNSGAEKRVRCETVLCAKGQNKYVDAMLDNGKLSEEKENEFPYTDVCGKTLKKKAVAYDDVKPWVEDDYEEELRQRWIESLRKKYPVEVNYDILKTVNQDNK